MIQKCCLRVTNADYSDIFLIFLKLKKWKGNPQLVFKEFLLVKDIAQGTTYEIFGFFFHLSEKFMPKGPLLYRR